MKVSILISGAALATLLATGTAPAPLDDDPIEVDILELTSIDYEEGKELPKKIRDLDGKKIVISGYMQSQPKKDVNQFLIVGNSCQCAGRPLVQHFVEVTLDDDKTTGYKPGQLTFIGTLEVGEVKEDGFVKSIYRLKGDFF